MIEKDTCGMYQTYFYINLLNPLENSSIISKKSLNKLAIEKLLNEILLTDRQENENRIEQFAEETIYSKYEMKLERHISESQSLLQEIVFFRQVLSCFC